MLLRLHVIDGLRVVEIPELVAAVEYASAHWDSRERLRRMGELGDALRHIETVPLDERGYVLAPRAEDGRV